jgi:hypothetical protein
VPLPEQVILTAYGGEDREDPVHEAHRRQVEEMMDTLAKGPEGFYK